MKKKQISTVMPKLTVLQPVVINVSNPPPKNVAPKENGGMFMESDVSEGEIEQGRVIDDSVMPSYVLRAKLNVIKAKRERKKANG